MKKISTLFLIFIIMPVQAQWVQQTSGTTENLNDVYCITEDIVVAVGNNGVIIKTTDGGLNWIQKTSGTNDPILDVKFLNQNIGFANGGGNGKFLRTIDGGENWSLINTGFSNYYKNISIIDGNTFFLSGSNGSIIKTIDGGNSFTSINSPLTIDVQDIQFINNQIGYVLVGNYNQMGEYYLYKTNNGGINWQLVMNDFVDSFYFVNENLGFISKNHQSIFKTSDGGLIFTEIVSGNIPFTNRLGIFTISGENIWSVGYTYALCSCEYYCIGKINNSDSNNPFDEGNTCIQDFNNSYPRFNGIHFATETTGYVVANNGKIYKNSTGNNVLKNENFEKVNKLKIYPNPSTEKVTVDFEEVMSQSITVKITDLLGKNVYLQTYQPSKSISIDTKSFSKGVYLLTITSNDKSQTEKLLIN